MFLFGFLVGTPTLLADGLAVLASLLLILDALLGTLRYRVML